MVVIEGAMRPGGHSTSRCAGGVRQQFSTRGNIELSLLSRQILGELGSRTRREVATNACGYLFLLTRDDDVDAYHEAMALQLSCGVDVEWLTRGQLAERIPAITLDDVVGATHSPQDGLLDVGAVVGAYAEAGRAEGIVVETACRVTGVETRSGGVCAVLTDRGRVQTDVIVNAAGPWAGDIARLAGLCLPVTPVQQQLLVTCAIAGVDATFPVVVVPRVGLGFHLESGGMLSGLHRSARASAARPEDVLLVDRVWETVHRETAEARLPAMARASVVARWAGLYAMSPDRNPILGRSAVLRGWFDVSGWSGHGFMHAPAAGRLIAEEVVDGRAHTIDIDPFRIGRFHRPVAAAERYVV